MLTAEVELTRHYNLQLKGSIVKQDGSSLPLQVYILKISNCQLSALQDYSSLVDKLQSFLSCCTPIKLKVAVLLKHLFVLCTVKVQGISISSLLLLLNCFTVGHEMQICKIQESFNVFFKKKNTYIKIYSTNVCLPEKPWENHLPTTVTFSKLPSSIHLQYSTIPDRKRGTWPVHLTTHFNLLEYLAT